MRGRVFFFFFMVNSGHHSSPPKKKTMFSTANAALWAESTAALEEDVSEDAYRLVRKPAKKGSSSEVGGGARGERGKREVGIDDFDCLSNVESSLRSLHSKSLASQTTTVLVCLCRSDRRCGVDAEKKEHRSRSRSLRNERESRCRETNVENDSAAKRIPPLSRAPCELDASNPRHLMAHGLSR